MNRDIRYGEPNMKNLWSLMLLSFVAWNSFGNAGVFRGGGQTPVLEKSAEVQMVEEEVVMIPRRGDYPVDTSGRNLDKMEFRCRFLLRNLTDQPVTLQVGFPLTSEALPFREPAQINQSEVISRFAFTAGTRDAIYPVRFVPWDKNRKFSRIFLWEMSFAPRETIELFVNYTMGGYMGMGTTSRRTLSTPGQVQEYQCRYLDNLTLGVGQAHFYVTETGSSWAGVIEKAVFRCYPHDFEEYLARRGAWEESETQRSEQLRKREKHPGEFNWLFSPSMPMVRFWTPAFERWRPVQGKNRYDRFRELVIQPFQPTKKDNLSLCYLFPCIPMNGDEFERFCDTLKFTLNREQRTRERIRKEKPETYEKYWKDRPSCPYSPAVRKNIADVVLEFHGIPRNNPAIRDFLDDQCWYPVSEPRPMDEKYKQMLLNISSGK